MKSNMEAMDVKMNQLQDTIGTVVTQSTDIQTKLQPKREQIEEMTRVRFLLQRLQVTFFIILLYMFLVLFLIRPLRISQSLQRTKNLLV